MLIDVARPQIGCAEVFQFHASVSILLLNVVGLISQKAEVWHVGPAG